MQAGSKLPAFAATAAVNGRVVDNAFLGGRKGVLVLHGATNTEAPKQVAKSVREKHPSHMDVALATIVDLRSFAGIWKKVAEAQVRQTYEKLAAKAKEAGLPPEEHVLICPDWDGAICASLGFPEAAKEAVAIVVGKDGTVKGVAKGPAIGADVLGLLA